jgi:hypothetical protein
VARSEHGWHRRGTHARRDGQVPTKAVRKCRVTGTSLPHDSGMDDATLVSRFVRDGFVKVECAVAPSVAADCARLLNGINTLDALIQAAAGNPWIPTTA